MGVSRNLTRGSRIERRVRRSAAGMVMGLHNAERTKEGGRGAGASKHVRLGTITYGNGWGDVLTHGKWNW